MRTVPRVASWHSGRSGFLHIWWGTNSYPSFSHVYNQVSPSSSHSYHPHLFSSEKHQPKSYGLHLPFLPSTSNKCLHQISIENHPSTIHSCVWRSHDIQTMELSLSGSRYLIHRKMHEPVFVLSVFTASHPPSSQMRWVACWHKLGSF